MYWILPILDQTQVDIKLAEASQMIMNNPAVLELR